MVLGGGVLGGGVLGGDLNVVVNAINETELITANVCKSIIKIIKRAFDNNLWKLVNDLIDMLPDLLAGFMEYYEIVMDILLRL